MLNKVGAHRYMYYFLKGKVTLYELEHWIYDHKELEDILGESHYSEMITRDYKSKYSFIDTEKQIRTIVDLGTYEQERIMDLLNSLTDCQDDGSDVMDILYDEYCNGYTFLRYIALVHVTLTDEYKESLEHNQKKPLDYNESVIKEAKRLLNFFNREELKITFEHEYMDERKEEDKIELHRVSEMFSEQRES